MAERLRDDPDGLGVLSARAAEWFSQQRGRNVPAVVVEKDFWVTEVLRAITQADPIYKGDPAAGIPDLAIRPVFKGGTSLSKAYDLIERFSEDADVFLHVTSVADGTLASRNRFDKVMKATALNVGTILGVASEEVSLHTAKHGWKRAFKYAYPGSAASSDAGYKEGVLLELVRMGSPSPNVPVAIGSMIARWAAATGELAADDWDELPQFSIDVLGADRTLVDKLAILHDLGVKLAENPTEPHRIAYQTRHYYDVHCLLSSPAVLQTLAATPDLVSTYAAEAYEDSEKARRTPAGTRPDGGYAASPAFSDSTVLDLVRAEYESEMARLSLGTIPDFADVINTVQRAADIL